MIPETFRKNGTRVIAHRGLSGLERENTNAAFVAAGNHSYYGIETDIHRTRDGHFAVIHDGDTRRVAGEARVVELSTLSELQNFVLLDMDGTKSRADLRIPTLENYIGICKRYEKFCILELKSDFTTQELRRIVSLCEEQAYLHRVVFISFDLEVLKRLRRELPRQPMQYLTGAFDDAVLQTLVENQFDLDIQYSALTRGIVETLHENGVQVNCWTVDQLEDAERLASWGVDFITSNRLE